jgi:hypothetical protein
MIYYHNIIHDKQVGGVNNKSISSLTSSNSNEHHQAEAARPKARAM